VTTAKKLWEKARSSKENPIDGDGVVVNVNCDYCDQYTDWKKRHSGASKSLQKLSDEIVSYKVCISR